MSNVDLQDSEYDNERLQQVTDESTLMADLVRECLDDLDTYGDGHRAIWLGTFTANRPRTQIQLVITQKPELMIDED